MSIFIACMAIVCIVVGLVIWIEEYLEHGSWRVATHMAAIAEGCMTIVAVIVLAIIWLLNRREMIG